MSERRPVDWTAVLVTALIVVGLLAITSLIVRCDLAARATAEQMFRSWAGKRALQELGK